MGTFTRFYCESNYIDSVTVRDSEGQLSINFWQNTKLKKEIILTKQDCEKLIIELTEIKNNLI